jgi:hypothetical protein
MIADDEESSAFNAIYPNGADEESVDCIKTEPPHLGDTQPKPPTVVSKPHSRMQPHSRMLSNFTAAKANQLCSK